MKLTKRGNSKIDKSCLIFNLPTSVCLHQCKNCYARRPEQFRPNVLKSRLAKLEASKQNNFVENMIQEIKKSKTTKFRIHESGDFYSQEYVDKWSQIIAANPEVKFYAYTKSTHLDYSKITSLKNFNLIRSVTPVGLNYGDDAHINNLKSLGYTVCPATVKGNTVTCMKDCTLCLTKSKVCFHKH